MKSEHKQKGNKKQIKAQNGQDESGSERSQ
jgi:hypothetical protein